MAKEDQEILQFIVSQNLASFVKFETSLPFSYGRLDSKAPSLVINLVGFEKVKIQTPQIKKEGFQDFKVPEMKSALDQLEELHWDPKKPESDKELENYIKEGYERILEFFEVPNWVQENLSDSFKNIKNFYDDLVGTIGPDNILTKTINLTKSVYKQGKGIANQINKLTEIGNDGNYNDAKAMLNSMSFRTNLDYPNRDELGLVVFQDLGITKDYWEAKIPIDYIANERATTKNLFENLKNPVTNTYTDIPYEHGSITTTAEVYKTFIVNNGVVSNVTVSTYLEHVKPKEAQIPKKTKTGIHDIILSLDAQLHHYIAYFTDLDGKYVNDALGSNYYFYLNNFNTTPVKKKTTTLKYNAYNAPVALNTPDGKNEVTFELIANDLELSTWKTVMSKMGYNYSNGIFASSEGSSKFNLKIVLLMGNMEPETRPATMKILLENGKRESTLNNLNSFVAKTNFDAGKELKANVFIFENIKFSSVSAIEFSHKGTEVTKLNIKGTYRRLDWERNVPLKDL